MPDEIGMRILAEYPPNSNADFSLFGDKRGSVLLASFY